MTHRTRFLAASGAWSVLVAVGLIVAPTALRHRLPDPIAIHWSFSGVADGSSPRALFWLLSLAVWIVTAATAIALGRSAKRRAQRGVAAAVLGFTALLFAGLTASTIAANLDQADWYRAVLPIWHVPAMLAASALGGLAGFLLGNRGPDEPGAQDETAGELTLPPGRRAVWVSSARSTVMLTVGCLALLVSVIIGAVALGDPEPLALLGALPALLVALVVLVFSSARVHVDDYGVRTALGPLRRPVRRIRLERISGARVATYRPMEVGGWGYRVLPGSTAIMLRGGECLVLSLTSGRDFVISVDRPERGAELVNALVAERSAL
jgi:hypothetical protein